jgi:hypothetical protein
MQVLVGFVLGSRQLFGHIMWLAAAMEHSMLLPGTVS